MSDRPANLFRLHRGELQRNIEFILGTNNLTKICGQKKAAKDVNRHTREGQIYGLIGRNGAGKPRSCA